MFNGFRIRPWLAILVVIVSFGATLSVLLRQQFAEPLRTFLLGTGESGLIYVESPEVYTRQRLVNDRYLQDHWLRQKLEEIESRDAVWIDKVELAEQGFRFDAAKDPATLPAPGTAPADGPELPENVEIPFGTKFQLQSDARDEIRQMILENALDDRHDLSGNTVFGLKFDTSVLPAARTRLSPTVIVRMKDDPIRQLPKDPADVAYKFVRSTGLDLSIVADTDAKIAYRRAVDNGVSAYSKVFEDWRNNLEERLNAHRAKRNRFCALPSGTEEDTSVPEAMREIIGTARRLQGEGALAGLRICRDGALDPALAPRIAGMIDRLALWETGALSFVLRVREAEFDTSALSSRRVMPNMAAFCAAPEVNPATDEIQFPPSDDRTLGGFFSSIYNRSDWQPLPSPWGDILQLEVSLDLRDSADRCGPSFDFALGARDIYLNIRQQDGEKFTSITGNELIGAGMEPLCALTECDESDPEAWLGYPRGNLGGSTAAYRIGDPDLLSDLVAVSAEINAAASQSDGWKKICFFRSQENRPWQLIGAPQPGQQIMPPAWAVETGAEETQWLDCEIMRSEVFKLGAYQFFRLLAKAESYTYAAFPRGDVSGVVTESRLRQDYSGAVGSGSGFAARLTASDDRRSRAVEARPSVINFAAGQGQRVRRSVIGGTGTPGLNGPPPETAELFDFGWSIVKDGEKNPMIASQLVLVSVPAYIKELELEIWKGFLDIDAAPFDRDAAPLLDGYGSAKSWWRRAWNRLSGGEDVTPTAGLGAPDPDDLPFNSRNLEGRLKLLLPSFEKREFNLKIPPDLSALDSLVTGGRAIEGPQIDDGEMEPGHKLSCNGNFEIAIPGERLWRSTLVTLDGVKADKIEVMPDMRGILVTFSARASDDSSAPIPVVALGRGKNLVVWTSEGHDGYQIDLTGVGDCRGGIGGMLAKIMRPSVPPEAAEASE